MCPSDIAAWDTYVNTHPQATLYHISAWKNIIEKTYGHKTYYLMAIRGQENGSQLTTNSSNQKETFHEISANSYELDSNHVVGILPLVHLKHFFFGNSLISIPFFDLGGILANYEETKKELLSEAIKLGHEIKANTIELRHTQPLRWLVHSPQLTAHSPTSFAKRYDLSTINHVTKAHKVRMLLELPESSEILMKSFKSKLRSQINKPIKEGLKAKIGGLELLHDFYDVFSINMRDLGSPLHSKKLIQHVLEEFSGKAKIVLVNKNINPLACSVIIGFKNTLENPWASALREYSRLSPNMLLYWTML